MKLQIVIVLALLIISSGTAIAIPPIPPPPPTTEPPETPEPEPPPGGLPPFDVPRKFNVFSAEPVMEGYAGSSINYNLTVTQKGYPDLVVHMTAEVPDKWKAHFSHNDFTLSPGGSVTLSLTLSPPKTTAAETHEITVYAVGKAKEDSLEVKSSVIITAMTYIIDVGVATFAVNPSQPRIGEPVTVTVTAVNYTQRLISDVVVEFLVNNRITSEQTVVLPAGVSLPVVFGWTAEEGIFTFLVRISATGDTNQRNDSVSFNITLVSNREPINALYQQALVYYANGDYALAQKLFSTVVAKYTESGEHDKAFEASQLQERCRLYIQAQELMDQGERALQMELYEEAEQYFEQAKDIYAQIGDTEKESIARQKLDEATAIQKSWLKYVFVGVCVGFVAIIVVKKLH